MVVSVPGSRAVELAVDRQIPTRRLHEPPYPLGSLEANNGRWELAGTVPEGLGVGDRVEVAGRPAPEVEGACGAQVIRVREIRPG
jgi:hypothetical protein